jgi:cell wall-associated NlpC family hydrolase
MLYSGNGPVSSLLSATLTRGNSGENVSRLQYRLYSLGYISKTSNLDGSYGNGTANAVALFQDANKLSATGIADPATLRKLYSTSAKTLPAGKNPADLNGVVTNPTTGTQKNNSTSISSTLASITSKYNSGMSAAEKLEYVIYVGQNQLGKPYVYGATGTSKYDCSGFTQYCFKQVGVTLPRTAQSQGYSAAYSRIENVSDLKRGDLVFFNTVSDSDSCDHAGIYLGAGWFIHASSGQAKVVISNLASNYYNRVFSWAHRPLG